MKFPKIKAMKSVQKNLVTMAYSMYCLGCKHGREGKNRLDYKKFCKTIKLNLKEGKSLWSEHESNKEVVQEVQSIPHI